MVLWTLGRMVARRLALRKGLAVSAALLLLLGWSLLYTSTKFGARRAEPRTVEMPSLRSSPPLSIVQHANTSSLTHLSSPPQKPPPLPQAVGVPHRAPLNVSQCKFSSTTSVADVDVQMLDVFDILPFDNPNGGVWKQGYDISYSMLDFEQEPLNVFVVPHSHNDPGWIKTFEEYYQRQTRLILNLMVEALSEDERRKFIWAEISYLDRWWSECGEEKRRKFKRLVERGQLEIVTGGWVMSDEANAHYFAMIDQMIEGHQWLAHNLPGVVPRSGWAIDPFGHTPTMAYILQRTGLDATLIHRVHYSIKKWLSQRTELEFAWRQPWDSRGSTDILTHMMPFYSYDIPHTCGPDPSVCCQFDFKRLPGGKVKCPWKKPPQAITSGNVAERAALLADQYRKKSRLFLTNTLLVPLGDDFRWDSDKEISAQFTNYQLLMDYMNSQPEMKINVKFGTLSDYFNAVRGTSWVQANVRQNTQSFPVLSGDFFTYSDREDHYWSGYYTSRPFYKHFDRLLESSVRLAEVLFSLSVGRGLPHYPTLPDLLTSAHRNLGLFQHHDGITGTAKDHVVVDYGQRMRSSIEDAQKVIQHSSQALLLGNQLVADNIYFTLEETHPSHDSLPQHAVVRVGGEGAQAVLLINPLTTPAEQTVRLTVDTHNVMVTDWRNVTVPCQVGPAWVGGVEISQEHFSLFFVARVPGLGLTQYHLWPGTEERTLASVQTINHSPQESAVFEVKQYPSKDFVLATAQLQATFSGSTGLLQSVVKGKDEVNVKVDFVTYGARKGRDRSGAYLFLPDREAQGLLSSWSTTPVTITVGPLLQEVHTALGLVTLQQQLYNSPGEESHSVAMTTLTDIRNENNKEVAMRLSTSIKSPSGVFYTDLNGWQLVRRKTVSKLPIQGNFYPMPTMAVLQNETHRLSLLSAQPLGVASLEHGWLEVMLDRRLNQDDQRGLGQGVKDNKVTAAHFRLLVEKRTQQAEAAPQLAYPSLLATSSLDRLLHSPHISFTSFSSKILPHIPGSLSLLGSSLPCDIHLLSLRSLPTEGGQPLAGLLLHRRAFDCQFEETPNHCSTSDGTVKLQNLFSGVEFSAGSEMFLSLLEEKAAITDPELSVHLDPMEIGAYRLSWQH